MLRVDSVMFLGRGRCAKLAGSWWRRQARWVVAREMEPTDDGEWARVTLVVYYDSSKERRERKANPATNMQTVSSLNFGRKLGCVDLKDDFCLKH